MQAWRLEKLGGALRPVDLPIPEPRPGCVVLRVEAVPLLSYMRQYLDGKLPGYSAPEQPFTPGVSGVATIHTVGAGVYHLAVGTRVFVSPHLVANERVAEPAQMLLGLTAMGADAKRLQADWPDGLLAEYAIVPASAVTPCDLPDPPQQLALAGRMAVPFGGLVRGRLAPGETVVITGATGSYGGAAVRVALALGAGRVIACGRDRDALARLRLPRVETVALTGDVEQLRDVRADLAFDIVGRATDANATLAALHGLRRGGRLVLMGSMTAPLPIDYTWFMRNNLELIGQFMYAPDAFARIFALVRAGLLDLAQPVKTFPLAELPAAIDVAAGRDNVVVMP